MVGADRPLLLPYEFDCDERNYAQLNWALFVKPSHLVEGDPELFALIEAGVGLEPVFNPAYPDGHIPGSDNK